MCCRRQVLKKLTDFTIENPLLRQNDGYGLTVTGGFPVKADSVKPNGAAFVAGVREGLLVISLYMHVTNKTVFRRLYLEGICLYKPNYIV
jgi:hypothetical protein